MEKDPHTEFKEKISERITQAAVAFSNTDGGTIYVGIKDSGEIVGVDDTDDTSLKCAQLLKDKVRPDIMLTSHIE